jgi:two-component system, cell cycle sensor histidine kinase and response regulator CckA
MIEPGELGAILDSMLEGVQILSPDWRYLHINEAAARQGQRTKAELLGGSLLSCYPGVEHTPFFTTLRQCMAERTSHVLENEFTFPDGSTGWFELRIDPVPLGLCILSIDITAKKQAEEARNRAEQRLAAAERLEAIGKLASGVAHDFNNMLTVMLSQGELALAEPTGPRRQDVEIMLAAARSSARLTQQLLSYSRRASIAPEVADLADILRELEPMLRRTLESRIDLVVDTSASVAQVEVDRVRIEQIVMNLVLNARDAIPERGRITVALAHAELDEDYARAHPGSRTGPHTMILVSDTGMGMDEKTRSRIFDPYFTTKGNGLGTGLGLATIFGIVRQHNGTIWVYSELGQGTSFKIYLPCAAQQALPLPPAKVAPAVTAKPRIATILVVDDLPDVAELMVRILQRDSHRILLAIGGAQALELWSEHSNGIDLLITDIMMPDIAGPELIRRLRASHEDLPVLCTSGYADSHLTHNGRMPRDVSFLEKPFTPTELLERVQQLIAQPRAGSDDPSPEREAVADD